MRPRRAIIGVGAFVDMHRALREADIAVDRGDHLGDRDRRCWPRQTIAAGRATRRRNQPGMRQRLQQLGDRRQGQPRRRSDRGGVLLPVGCERQMGCDDDAVIGEL